MAIDEIPNQQENLSSEGSNHRGMFVGVFIILGALGVGEFYTLSQMSTMRGSFDSYQVKLQKDEQDITARISTIERSDAQQFEALKSELGASTKRMGSTGGEVRRARAMVAKLEEEQKHEAEALKLEIARKADQEQLGSLTQDVSATKNDLDGTKKSVDTLRSDLGMAKSELGTLIARNHDDLETLRKLGERDYFEFTVARKHPQHVAGIGLTLKKTNVKALRYSVVLMVDDMQIEKKDRTANEPIFFFVGGSKKPYEIVVNKIRSDKVTGYVSVPKGAVEVAERSGGAGA